MSGKTNHQLFWIIWGIGVAFVVRVIYDFLGDPFFTRVIPKQWWGIVVAGVILLIMTVWTLMRRPR